MLIGSRTSKGLTYLVAMGASALLLASSANASTNKKPASKKTKVRIIVGMKPKADRLTDTRTASLLATMKKAPWGSKAWWHAYRLARMIPGEGTQAMIVCNKRTRRCVGVVTNKITRFRAGAIVSNGGQNSKMGKYMVGGNVQYNDLHGGVASATAVATTKGKAGMARLSYQNMINDDGTQLHIGVTGNSFRQSNGDQIGTLSQWYYLRAKGWATSLGLTQPLGLDRDTRWFMHVDLQYSDSTPDYLPTPMTTALGPNWVGWKVKVKSKKINFGSNYTRTMGRFLFGGFYDIAKGLGGSSDILRQPAATPGTVLPDLDFSVMHYGLSLAAKASTALTLSASALWQKSGSSTTSLPMSEKFSADRSGVPLSSALGDDGHAYTVAAGFNSSTVSLFRRIHLNVMRLSYTRAEVKNVNNRLGYLEEKPNTTALALSFSHFPLPIKANVVFLRPSTNSVLTGKKDNEVYFQVMYRFK